MSDVITVELLDALKEAYFRGAIQVRHGDKDLRFASGDDLWQRIKRLSVMLGVPVPGQRFRRSFAKYNRKRA